MKKTSRIFVAGGRGLVGSALLRKLQAEGYEQISAPTSSELDLTSQVATQKYFADYKPEFVFLAAAKVGGIWANDTYPADFCYINLMIQNNVIHNAYLNKVQKLLFLGSSCVYPKDSPIPIPESALMSGHLESTNEGYAIAKITGIKLCDAYRKQYGCDFISAMPTNTYGPNDNYDLQNGHMVPALIHRFWQAKQNSTASVTVWGSGNPRRELIHVDDVADACLYLMQKFSGSGPINVGTGEDFSIREIAELIKKLLGYQGTLALDPTKPDGVFRKVMDVSRLKGEGWTPKYSLESGIKQAIEWFEANYAKKLKGT